MISEELKPCPFCGEPASKVSGLGNEEWYGCDNPKCHCCVLTATAEQWNRRTALTESAATSEPVAWREQKEG